MRLDRITLPGIWALALLCASSAAQTTTRLSLGSGGTQGNGTSGEWYDPQNGGVSLAGQSVSGDGRYVAFASIASDLVPGDTNGDWDVFVRDRQTGSTIRVSVGVGGVESNGLSDAPSISSDGRYVAFLSSATNLVAGGTNGVIHVFVRDLQAGTTTLVSVSSTGVQGNLQSGWITISATGRYVVFNSDASNLVPGDTNNATDVFVHDLQTGTTMRVNVDSSGIQANDESDVGDAPGISADGRFVAFGSRASNLVPGDTNNAYDTFVHDLQTGATTRVSVDSGGGQSNGQSYDCSMSADGRYVAFMSFANNLVAGDTNGAEDVFVHDRQTGITTLVSSNVFGNPSHGGSDYPSISADGRFLEFFSSADDLVFGDTNGVWDVFVQDLQTGARTRVSVNSPGTQGNGYSMSFFKAISTDGRFSIFASGATNLVAGDTNGVWDIFLHDLQTGATTRESVQDRGFQGDGASSGPSFSDGAQYVSYSSEATNLVPADLNGQADVFVRDLATGATTLASVSSTGVQGDMMSATSRVSSDGRYVAFLSMADNLVTGDTNGTWDVFRRDLQSGTTSRVSVSSGGAQGASGSTSVAMSSDGRYVAFDSADSFVPGDTNGVYDVFVRDLQAGTLVRASLGSSGAQGNDVSIGASLSSDGRYVAFESVATNLVAGDTNGVSDCFVRDLQAGTTVRVSVSSSGVQGDGDSNIAVVSADGRYVVFDSLATNLVPGDTNGTTDVFVRDLQTGITTRESVSSNGTQGNGHSYFPAISSGGRFVAFVSLATNLVPGDTNGLSDVFVHDRLTGRTTRASLDSTGVQGNGQSPASSLLPALSSDGRLVAFDSYATNLVPDDTNGTSDVFLRDRGSEAVFAPFCPGDGTAGACPCGNSGGSGRGCQNSASTGGAVLTGTGVPSLAIDTVQLTSSGELPTSTSILLQGPALVAPAIYGDGLRCTGGSLKRLFTHSAVGGSVAMPQGADPSISARSAAMGAPIPVGATRFYQVYYRDSSATFCPNPPGSTFNISNAIAIQWGS